MKNKPVTDTKAKKTYQPPTLQKQTRLVEVAEGGSTRLFSGATTQPTP